MRNLLLVALVVAGLSAAIRIEGVWPPEPVRDYVQQVVHQVTEPGRILKALLSPRPSSPTGLPVLTGLPEAPALFRAVADRHDTIDASAAECG